MTTDQKSRNPYKRYWRNVRNAEQAVTDATAALRRAQKSSALAGRALREMETAR